MASHLRDRLEAARQRAKRHAGTAATGIDCNLLIISDTHLGEYIKEHARIDYLKRMADIDQDLRDFLEYYAEHRQDGKPWRLVINGDFLDFLTVTITPSQRTQEHLPELKLDEEERTYGLDAAEDKVAWKLERIAERHQLVFTYLADFVGRGHYLDMLYGNHDAEFFWPRAKRAFIELLVRVYFGTETVPGKNEEQYAGRIRFHEWFYYEPGSFYIEHGNQYDDFSSFEYRLCPILPFRSDDLAMPVSHMAIRYFVNKLDGFTTHNKDNWTSFDYLIWTSRQGWQQVKFILKSYAKLIGRLIRHSKRLQRAEHYEIAATHQKRMDELADDYDLEPETVRSLDALHNRPVHHTTGGAIQAFSLDASALWLSYIPMLIIALLLPGWPMKLIGLVILALLFAARGRLLRGIQNLFLGGEVNRLIPPKLDAAAESVAELLDVRYVFMGHTHRPVVREVRHDPPCWYINSGAWIVPQYKERHMGGCRSPLTFVVMLDRTVPEAQLTRWCQRNNRPEPFDPRLPAEAEATEDLSLDGEGAGRGREEGTPTQPQPAVKRDESAGQKESLRKRRY